MCVWCGKGLPPDGKVFGLQARFRKNLDLSEKKSRLVPISVVHANKTFLATATKSLFPDENGVHLLFRTCGQLCARRLESCLQIEKLLFAQRYFG